MKSIKLTTSSQGIWLNANEKYKLINKIYLRLRDDIVFILKIEEKFL